MPSRPQTPRENGPALAPKEVRRVALGFKPGAHLQEFSDAECSDPEEGHYRGFVNSYLNNLHCDEGDDFDVLEPAGEVP